MRLSAARQRGVTFLEMMVVVVILGILIAIAIPNMAGPRERAMLRGTARDLASAGLLARQTAMSQGWPTYLYVDKENGSWQLSLMPELDKRERREFRDGTPTLAEEKPRELHELMTINKVITDYEVLDDDDRYILTFYPNGSSSGMAVMLENSREKSLTVDFEKVSGRPDVYPGEPKSFAQKMKEQGIDLAKYGLQDPDSADAAGTPGEGFKRTAGMDSEERVQYYKDAAERMIKRSERKYWSDQQGAAQFYRDTMAWGQ